MNPSSTISYPQLLPLGLEPWPSLLAFPMHTTGLTSSPPLHSGSISKTVNSAAVCYWLGVPLHNTQFSCHCLADAFGDHQVGCGGNSDRISRHNAIRDIVFNAAQSAALGPSKETTSLVESSASCPADVLPNWCHGRPAALDLHVISSLKPLTISKAAQTPGHALEVGVQRKVSLQPP